MYWEICIPKKLQLKVLYVFKFDVYIVNHTLTRKWDKNNFASKKLNFVKNKINRLVFKLYSTMNLNYNYVDIQRISPSMYK